MYACSQVASVSRLNGEISLNVGILKTVRMHTAGNLPSFCSKTFTRGTIGRTECVHWLVSSGTSVMSSAEDWCRFGAWEIHFHEQTDKTSQRQRALRRRSCVSLPYKTSLETFWLWRLKGRMVLEFRLLGTDQETESLSMQASPITKIPLPQMWGVLQIARLYFLVDNATTWELWTSIQCHYQLFPVNIWTLIFIPQIVIGHLCQSYPTWLSYWTNLCIILKPRLTTLKFFANCNA